MSEVPKIKLKRLMTAYEILSVDPTSKDRHKQIRKNYLSLIRKHHPDAGGSSSVFRAIRIAYDYIGDTAMRIQYDHMFEDKKMIDMTEVIEEIQKNKLTPFKKIPQNVFGLLMPPNKKKRIKKRKKVLEFFLKNGRLRA